MLASNNPGKLREFAALFSTVGIEIVPQGELAVPEAEEPFRTFIENALTKARHASQLTGLPAIADDSGLCVRALRGAPGVYSARYAQRAGREKGDAANNAYLVEQLRGIDDRRAYYCCVLALVRHADDPEPLFAEGRWEGEIVDTPRGEHGFGYDPYFYSALARRDGRRTRTGRKEYAQPSGARAEGAARAARGGSMTRVVNRVREAA